MIKVTQRTSYIFIHDDEKEFELTFRPIEDSIIVEKTDKGYEIRYLVRDDDAVSSRESCDNLGKMICFHEHYDLGDKHDYKTIDFSSWSDMEQELIKREKAVVILPLYLYDHSGLRMKIGSFHGLLPQGHAEFDSGQVGFILARKEDVLKEYGVSKITKDREQKVTAVLENEVEAYDQYLVGDVYGCICEHFDESRESYDHDSVWGFYGYQYALEALQNWVF